jgi:hypothetical protein
MRPREFALLLLTSGDLLPRQRVRNQTPDTIGLELKRRLLQSLVDLDPEPGKLDETLARLIEELGPPTGPVRALAVSFRDEWQALPANPEWLEHLRAEAASLVERGSGGAH